ncbi:uncharacterized protein C24B11.05-like [Curcuma longa]|uniref:uncharacterized protein C24B11.05-like n=1 Tax=Curcuma longa TaxID=136217 RepID=UPI003D9F69C5
MEFDYATPFNCLLFDLDDTLYSPAIGIGRACRNNIEEFLASKCGISAEEASSLRAELFQSHGSSLAGLRAQGYDVHPDEYHSYVHGRLPYDLIEPDATLRELLLSVPQRKILFTNSDRRHATRVMQRLGIEDCFQRIICFETMNPHLFEDATKCSKSAVILKPSAAAMEMAVRLAGVAPHRTLFLDDSERNIDAGKAVGLRTALVGKRVKTQAADYLLGSIAELKQMIPEIWKKLQDGTTTARSELDLESMRPTSPIGA